MSIPLVIECGNHQFAPWVIICTHLVEGESQEWIPIELAEDDMREVNNDWVCPACHEKHLEGKDSVDDLKLVCIHCVRKIRQLQLGHE